MVTWPWTKNSKRHVSACGDKNIAQSYNIMSVGPSATQGGHNEHVYTAATARLGQEVVALRFYDLHHSATSSFFIICWHPLSRSNRHLRQTRRYDPSAQFPVRICRRLVRPPWNNNTTGEPLLVISSYTVPQKTSHLWLAVTLAHVNGFWHFFGRNTSDKESNQNTFFCATSNNLCFWTTVQNGKHENHIFTQILH